MGEAGKERREPLAEQTLLVSEVPESRSPTRAPGLEEGAADNAVSRALRTQGCVRSSGLAGRAVGRSEGREGRRVHGLLGWQAPCSQLAPSL